MKKLFLPCVALLIAAAATLHAQPSDAPADRPAPPEGGGGRHRPPPSPLFLALDTNHDGELSTAEIANAPKSLLTLDKNGDGKLDRSELRPARPAGAPAHDGPPPPPSDGK